MKKPLIPFGWMPGHWGLKGTTREIAKAEYELTGIDLELALAEIRIPDAIDREREKLAILRSYGRITLEEFARKIIDLAPIDDNQRKLEHLEQDLKSGKITQEQHDRRRADVVGEPWVSMPRIHWNPAGKARAYFELEYNDHFLKQLRDNGYEGDDAAVVNQWMNEICESVITESYGNEESFVSSARRSGGPNPDDE
jgi:hypothetical protein